MNYGNALWFLTWDSQTRRDFWAKARYRRDPIPHTGRPHGWVYDGEGAEFHCRNRRGHAKPCVARRVFKREAARRVRHAPIDLSDCYLDADEQALLDHVALSGEFDEWDDYRSCPIEDDYSRRFGEWDD